MKLTPVSARSSVEVDPARGGRVTSFIIDGIEVIGSVSERHLEQELGPRKGRRPDWYGGSFPIAPWVGRLPGGRFQMDDVEYRVPSDEAGDAMHGVVSEVAWEVESFGGSFVSMSCDFGPRSLGGWPFEGRATQTIHLDDSALRMVLEVASVNGPMPANVGFHPWFRRCIGGNEATVEFAPRRRIQTSVIPFETTSDLGERPWDDLFTDLERSPQLSWLGGPNLTLESNATVWVYYERLPGAFCIEPWSGPSGLESGRSVVWPDKPLLLTFDIEYGDDPPRLAEQAIELPRQVRHALQGIRSAGLSSGSARTLALNGDRPDQGAPHLREVFHLEEQLVALAPITTKES